jgi:hypothetical protein
MHGNFTGTCLSFKSLNGLVALLIIFQITSNFSGYIKIIFYLYFFSINEIFIYFLYKNIILFLKHLYFMNFLIQTLEL